MKKVASMVVFASLMLLSGCGGGGSSESSDVFYTGYLKDEAVSGMNYRCYDSKNNIVTGGTTDMLGSFKYTPDTQRCDFGVEAFGRFKALTTKTNAEYPFNRDGVTIYPVDIAQLLQILDIDGNLYNGILITDDEKEVVMQYYFPDNLENLYERLVSMVPDYHGRYYDAQTALNHITQNMQHSFLPGTYTGTFNATDNNPECERSGNVYINLVANSNGYSVDVTLYNSEGSANAYGSVNADGTFYASGVDDSNDPGYVTGSIDGSTISGTYHSQDGCSGVFTASYQGVNTLNTDNSTDYLYPENDYTTSPSTVSDTTSTATSSVSDFNAFAEFISTLKNAYIEKIIYIDGNVMNDTKLYVNNVILNSLDSSVYIIFDNDTYLECKAQNGKVICDDGFEYVSGYNGSEISFEQVVDDTYGDTGYSEKWKILEPGSSDGVFDLQDVYQTFDDWSDKNITITNEAGSINDVVKDVQYIADYSDGTSNDQYPAVKVTYASGSYDVIILDYINGTIRLLGDYGVNTDVDPLEDLILDEEVKFSSTDYLSD
jgi:hypothetical protein